MQLTEDISMKHSHKAILVVSFGTSYEDARKATIERIENDITAAFPEYRIYRAWTSRMILSILKKRDQITIPNVREAMEQMIDDGITEVVVQPTHILDGIENHAMKDEILSYKEQFRSISFGTPLLSGQKDAETVVHAIAKRFEELDDNTALVLMGHGTTHQVNHVYEELDQLFKDMGYPNIFLGTVEAKPSVQELIHQIGNYRIPASDSDREEACTSVDKVVLAPFMIVAGDHAHNDMAGSHPESWLSRFQEAGYEAESVLKGLGAYEKVRELFVEHVQTAISQREL